jgi:FkbM family methyltransferase
MPNSIASPPKVPGVGTISMAFGRIRLWLPRQDTYIYYATFVAGEYDRLRIRPGDTVLDAGASVGDFALRASRLVGRTGRVIAVEPNPPALAYLRSNVERNRASNVTIVEAALDSAEGTVGLAGEGTTAHIDRTHPEETGVARTTLDALADRYCAGRIDVVKMDIEGGELDALTGQRVLASVREIALELHGPKVTGPTLELLRASGFALEPYTRFDLSVRSLANSVRHPLDVVGAEVRSGAEGFRGAMGALNGRSPVPALRPTGGISIYYGHRRRPSSDAPGNR